METDGLQTAKLTNTLNNIGYGAFNHKGIINRNDILSSYNKDVLEKAWVLFTNFIIKNYQSGRGTNVKGFGTFTYTNVDVSLEGTTNQYKRDVKKRMPVFLVSNEFLDYLKPGQFTKAGGLIYYTQKKNNSIPIVKLNLAELAYGLNISKEEYNNILNNILKEMSEQILRKNFKSREMPNLGILLLRGNVFGMKFYNDFNTDVNKQAQKLIHTKNNLELYMDTYKTRQASADLPNAARAVDNLRPKTSVITHVQDNADFWMEQNLNIEPKQYDNNENTKFNDVENFNKTNRFNSKSFFPVVDLKYALKDQSKKLTLRSINLPKSVLEALVSSKGIIIREMKNFDKKNSGLISKFEVARAFVKANPHPSLTMNNYNDIIRIYANGKDYIDYYKLITLLIKEAKYLLKNTSFSMYGEFDLGSTFNNKFTLGPKSKEIRSRSLNNENRKDEFNIDDYDNLVVTINEVEDEIRSFKTIFEEIMNKKTLANNEKFNNFDKDLNYKDLIQLLRIFGITYPTDKIIKILKYIKVRNPYKFSLNTLNEKLLNTKVTSYEMNNYEIEEAYHDLIKKIKDFGGKNFLFGNDADLSIDQFLKRLRGKTNYTNNILTVLFKKFSKDKELFTLEDFDRISNEVFVKKEFSPKFYEQSIARIKDCALNHFQLTLNKYFDKLLNYNYLRQKNVLPLKDFILSFKQEPYEPPFTDAQLTFIFENMDTNKDGVVDREEFKAAVRQNFNCLFEMQDIIKKNKWDIEDICYRLNIKMDENKKLTFYPFKEKMKLLDYTYSNEFIEGLYEELAGSLNNSLDTNTLIKKFNVYQRDAFIKANKESFQNNFISNIQSVVDYHTLKAAFEKEDKKFSGKIPKDVFCKVIHRFTNEYKDEDINRFLRVAKLVDLTTYEIIYPNFLNLIYFNAKADVFILCINYLKKILTLPQINNDIHNLIHYINKNNESNYINVDTLYNFFKANLKRSESETLTKIILNKFDLDSDGLISFEDLKGIIERYINTSFFKYENSEKGQNVNLYASDVLTDSQFKLIVHEIKKNLKKKNVTEVGLFKKLDQDNDGFISNYEFNKNISDYCELSPAMKDKIFNYLDFYHNGLVDLETFQKRFKEFKSNEAIIQNNNTIENKIIKEFSNWIIKTNKTSKLSDSDVFVTIDTDNDGLINLNDFRIFITQTLGISEIEFNDYKLERVMQSISLTGNKNIGLGDIREFINKSLSNESTNYYVDLKETFKETKNPNLFRGKKNVDWINQLIERFGMFISEKYDNVEKFYEKYSDKDSGKFKYENFIKFNEENYECFFGFNLTKDELLAIYTTLDSQKKNFLNLDDFKNKLTLFDFYKKMHFDIKQFLQGNFPTSIDAFRFFLPSDINKVNSSSLSKTTYGNKFLNKNPEFINKKQFFDGINYLFPKKYTTNTILKYIKKFFNIDENDNNPETTKISFSVFTFVYYGKIKSNNTLNSNNLQRTNIATTRTSITAKNNNNSLNSSFNSLTTNTEIPSDHPTDHWDHPFELYYHPKLSTPFDKDPLEKLKRTIYAGNNQEFLTFIKLQMVSHPLGIVNIFEFRNLLKSFNLGLTTVEIEDIINRAGKTRDGKLDLNVLYKFLSSKDKNIEKAENNIKLSISTIKQLLYKYYSNPKLAFTFCDSSQSNMLDFGKYKAIIAEMYKREGKPMPNFTLLKNTFDYIDIRKDGYIDMNEWTNIFGNVSGKLDNTNGLVGRKLRNLRRWETSDNVIGIYKAIARNRKLITEKVKNIAINKNTSLIQQDNLIKILKEVFPQYRLSNTQWKMIVQIGDKDTSDFINYDVFIKLVEHCANRDSMPRF